jgi:GLPGLI family protein
MRFFFILFSIIFWANLFSQKINTVNYGCLIHLSDVTKSVDRQHNLLSKAEDVAEEVNFRLEFNENQSAFYLNNASDIDPMSLHMLKALTKTNGEIFVNYNDEIVFKEITPKGNLIYILGNENILIQDSIYKNWDITNETKVIDGYICYKAKYLKNKLMLDKVYSETAIAWFCPEVPFSFGPSEFLGLPGLIFHLQTNEFSFVLKDMSFNPDLILKKPSNGKIMSLNEYLKANNENIERIKEMAKSFKE